MVFSKVDSKIVLDNKYHHLSHTFENVIFKKKKSFSYPKLTFFTKKRNL